MSVLDTIIARLAGRQHGVVARWQLIALGFDPRQSSDALRTGGFVAFTAGYTRWVKSVARATGWLPYLPAVKEPC